MKYVALLSAILPGLAFGCELNWDYDDSLWIEGFRVFQDGVQVGTAAPADRSGECEALGLVPGPGPITMTAYRGADTSPQSDPATFELLAPGVRVTISTPERAN